MSALPNQKRKWTVEEYLDFEGNSETKHEFINGEVIAMAGAKRNHVLIVSRVSARLETQLENQPCEVYQTDMRVRVGKEYVYPDLAVVCGEPEIIDERGDTLLNPTVIIEVLSKGTAARDRGEKWLAYQKRSSLQDYILIEQTEMHIEHYHRQADNRWSLVIFTNADNKIELTSIGCNLVVGDIYAKVKFKNVDENEIDSP